MKKLLYLTLISCSSLCALPAWQFEIESYIDGKLCGTEMLCPSDVGVESCMAVTLVEPHFFATVTCSELHDSLLEYVVELSYDMRSGGENIAKGTVVAPIGEDATLTISNDHGEFTITFSSKL